jgi:hypothetical protein
MLNCFLASRANPIAVAAAMVAFAWFATGAANSAVAADGPIDRSATDAAFADELEKLALKCDELGLKEQAELTREWAFPRDHRRQYLFLPSTTNDAPKGSAPQVVQQWHAKFRKLRAEHAAGLFSLARKSLDEHRPADAYRLLHEVLRDDPDHADARRALGYTKGTGGWLPRPASWRAEPGRTDHPRYGWRRGQYWRVETTHYQIATDHSAKAALELAGELENLVSLWKQTFFDFWADEAWLRARFDGQADKEPLAAKMQIVLFKNRDEYLAVLGKAQPQLAMTTGIYIDTQLTAFFYAAEPAPRTTWRHEATHQLFQQFGRHGNGVGEKQNFWIVEGAAMYMESLAEHSGYWTVGGWEAARLQLARYRALSGDFRLPLGQLVLMGREELQQSPDIRKLYSQAAGMTHFLLDDEGGRRRTAAIDYLLAVYQQTDAPQSLAAVTKTSLAELDRQYLAFLNVTDEDLKHLPGREKLTELSLGRTQVTDQGMQYLARSKSLRWLDLSQTKVTDAGLALLPSDLQVEQLFLEGSGIGSASLARIGGFKKLEELDLAGMTITDDDLQAISGLKSLKSLYLSRTPIGDDGLKHLFGLKQLESLDLSGTRVTAEGAKALRRAIPKLTIDGV